MLVFRTLVCHANGYLFEELAAGAPRFTTGNPEAALGHVTQLGEPPHGRLGLREDGSSQPDSPAALRLATFNVENLLCPAWMVSS